MGGRAGEDAGEVAGEGGDGWGVVEASDDREGEGVQPVGRVSQV